MATTHKSFCRFCHANCGIEVTVEEGRATLVRGDRDDPMFGGYTCLKGREMPAQYTHPERLLHSQKRRPDGGFEAIDSQAAFDEIAEKLRVIIDRYGPRAVAVYSGTYAFMNSAAVPVSAGFQKGLGSPRFYTPVTIDQPAKVYTWARVGQWLGGSQAFKDADVMMMIGNNPLTSHYAPPNSLPAFSPSRRLRDAKKAGLKLICIDPRRTPTAKQADIHLQVRPGEDPTLLGGMLRIILDEGRHDVDFCNQHVDGIGTLREAIDGLTPEYVAHRADVPIEDLYAAARMFAAGPRGIAATGTGTEMTKRGTLTEHLVIALNTVCGRFCREGEVSPIARVLSPATPRKAQVEPPTPLWGEGFEPCRVRGLTQIGEEMPTTTVADEILTPGDGQIRALLCVGGNPVVAWPNQRKVRQAMEALDLLVSVDIRFAQTARLADYVIAPKHCLERQDITSLSEWWFQEPYANFSEAVVEPPEGSDVIDEWELFWELARRLGTEIPTLGGKLPMDRKPSKFEVLQMCTQGAPVALDEVRRRTRDGGTLFEEATPYVQPPDPEAQEARLQLAPEGVPAELKAMYDEPLDARGCPIEAGFPASHLLVNRRSQQFYNSSGQELEALRAKGTTNYAYMHPSDIDALGCEEDDVIEIASRHDAILGVVRAAKEIRPGAISMSHAFGDLGEDARSVRERGATTSRLVSDEEDIDPITGHCRASAIPVQVRAYQAETA